MALMTKVLLKTTVGIDLPHFREELKKKDDELKEMKKDLADANAQVCIFPTSFFLVMTKQDGS